MAVEPSAHSDDRLRRLERRLVRERVAREEAERLLEEKSSELYDLNERLKEQVENIMVLQQSVDMASDGIAITDADGLFMYMNSAHAEMFDYSVDELIGQPWSVLYGVAEKERLGASIFPTLGSIGSWRGETYGLSKTDRTIVQEIVLTKLPSGGLICATRDISEKRKRELYARDLETRLQKAEREAALFTLGNAVAHDFNNLIAAISGNAALLKVSLREDFDNYHRANQIEVATRQAASVIRSLNVERSNETRQLTLIDLAELMRTGLQIAEAIRPAGVRILTEIPDEAIILSNEVVLTRSLLNIVKNAFEATEGEGVVRLRVAKIKCDERISLNPRYLETGTNRDDPVWVVEISDSGSGIPEGKLDHIFEDFFTTKPQLAGSGLGLQALRTLADSGNVHVEVETDVNVGTRFRLSFFDDVTIVEGPETQIEFENTVVQKQSQNLRILLVDDNALVGRMLEDALLQMHFLPDWTDDPREALERIKSDRSSYDLVITDLTMPFVDGADLSRRIKTLLPTMPVIIYSGQANLIEPSPIFASILQKPISMEALNAAIWDAVSRV